MEIFTNKSLIKKISVVLIILTVLTTIIPLYSYADTDEKVGGKLFKPMFKLFAAIGDLVIKGLQDIFVGYTNLKEAQFETASTQSNTFYILYSPGIIFSNMIPGLDANFINPSQKTYKAKITKSGELKEISSKGTTRNYDEPTETEREQAIKDTGAYDKRI